MQQIVTEITSVENQISQFFHNHSIGMLLRQCNIRKEKGILIAARLAGPFVLSTRGSQPNAKKAAALPDGKTATTP